MILPYIGLKHVKIEFGVNMKHKLSITMDEELILKVLDSLRSRRFRNKSHVIEYAVSRFFEGENGKA